MGLELSISSPATAQKGLKYKPHDERLKLLGNTSPKKKIRDLIQVFRKVKGFDAVDFATFFEWDNGGGRALRGQRWKLKVNRCRLHLRCFFSQRIISTWNKLPASVMEASSANSFKEQLNDWSKDAKL